MSVSVGYTSTVRPFASPFEFCQRIFFYIFYLLPRDYTFEIPVYDRNSLTHFLWKFFQMKMIYSYQGKWKSTNKNNYNLTHTYITKNDKIHVIQIFFHSLIILRWAKKNIGQYLRLDKGERLVESKYLNLLQMQTNQSKPFQWKGKKFALNTSTLLLTLFCFITYFDVKNYSQSNQIK